MDILIERGYYIAASELYDNYFLINQIPYKNSTYTKSLLVENKQIIQ
jgi:hypothetical protein